MAVRIARNRGLFKPYAPCDAPCGCLVHSCTFCGADKGIRKGEKAGYFKRSGLRTGITTEGACAACNSPALGAESALFDESHASGSCEKYVLFDRYQCDLGGRCLKKTQYRTGKLTTCSNHPAKVGKRVIQERWGLSRKPAVASFPPLSVRVHRSCFLFGRTASVPNWAVHPARGCTALLFFTVPSVLPKDAFDAQRLLAGFFLLAECQGWRAVDGTGRLCFTLARDHACETGGLSGRRCAAGGRSCR